MRPGDAQPVRCERPSPLRGRVILAAATGIALNVWIIAKVEVGRWIALGTMWGLSPLVLTETLFAFLLLYPLRRSPRWGWRAADYLALYILLTLGTAPASFDGVYALTGLLAFPYSPHAQRIEWMETWLRHIPPWALVSDPRVADTFVLGNHDVWREGLWVSWLQPVLLWTGLLVTLSLIYLGLSCLLHRQWSQRQRLAYPLVRIPIEFFAADPPIWRRKAFWVSSLLVAALATLNRWGKFYPFIPTFSTDIRQIVSPFPDRPWNALGDIFIGCPPWMLGMAYLVPQDVLLSSWACYWVWRVLPVVASTWGYDQPQNLHLLDASFGAYLGLGLIALWLARRHLLDVFLQLVGSKPRDDQQEPLSYPAALLLIALGGLGLWGWSRALGLSANFALTFFGLLVLIGVAVARVRAELGAAIYGMMGMCPLAMLARTVGVEPFTANDLAVGMGIMNFGMTYGQRSNLMPLQVEGLKIAEHQHGRRSDLVLGMMAAPALGVLLGIAAAVTVYTSHGALSSKVLPAPYTVYTWAFNSLAAWKLDPPRLNSGGTLALVLGAVVVVVLQMLRVNVPYFPLHPLGFAIAGDYNAHFLWGAMALAWLVKSLLIRYSSLKVYRSLMPVFVGMMVGDFAAMVINGLILFATDLPVTELVL